MEIGHFLRVTFEKSFPCKKRKEEKKQLSMVCIVTHMRYGLIGDMDKFIGDMRYGQI